MEIQQWPPSGKIQSYTGPYPIRDLELARKSLIKSFVHDKSAEMRSLKRKIGVPLKPRSRPRSPPDHSSFNTIATLEIKKILGIGQDTSTPDHSAELKKILGIA